MNVGKSNPVGFKTTLKSTTPSKTGNKHYHLENNLKNSIAKDLGITVKSSDTNKTPLGSVMLAVVKESGVAINFDGTDLTDKAIINTIGQHIRDTLSKGPLSENEMNLTDQMYTLLKTARGHSDSAVFTDASREKRFHYDDTGNPTDALRSGNNKSTTAWSSFFKDCMAFHNILKPSPNTAKMIFESKGESINDNDAKAIFTKIGATKNQINSQLQQGQLLKAVMDLPASTSSDSVFNFLPKIPEAITSFATNPFDSFTLNMDLNDVSTEPPLTNKTGTPLSSIPEDDETETAESQNPVTPSDDGVSVESTTNASTKNAPDLEISTLGVPLPPKDATKLSSIFSSKTFNRINQTLGSMISNYSLNPKDVRAFIVKTYIKASQFSLKSPLKIEATPSGSGAGTSENNAVEADSTEEVTTSKEAASVVKAASPETVVGETSEKDAVIAKRNEIIANINQMNTTFKTQGIGYPNPSLLDLRTLYLELNEIDQTLLTHNEDKIEDTKNLMKEILVPIYTKEIELPNKSEFQAEVREYFRDPRLFSPMKGVLNNEFIILNPRKAEYTLKTLFEVSTHQETLRTFNGNLPDNATKEDVINELFNENGEVKKEYANILQDILKLLVPYPLSLEPYLKSEQNLSPENILAECNRLTDLIQPTSDENRYKEDPKNFEKYKNARLEKYSFGFTPYRDKKKYTLEEKKKIAELLKFAEDLEHEEEKFNSSLNRYINNPDVLKRLGPDRDQTELEMNVLYSSSNSSRHSKTWVGNLRNAAASILNNETERTFQKELKLSDTFAVDDRTRDLRVMLNQVIDSNSPPLARTGFPIVEDYYKLMENKKRSTFNIPSEIQSSQAVDVDKDLTDSDLDTNSKGFSGRMVKKGSSNKQKIIAANENVKNLQKKINTLEQAQQSSIQFQPHTEYKEIDLENKELINLKIELVEAKFQRYKAVMSHNRMKLTRPNSITAYEKNVMNKLKIEKKELELKLEMHLYLEEKSQSIRVSKS